MPLVAAEFAGDEVRAALAAACEAALEAVGARATEYARALAPVRSGALQASIVCEVEGDAVAVGSPLEYAPYVELGAGEGRRHIAARPFLRPALAEHLGEYREIIEGEMRRN